MPSVTFGPFPSLAGCGCTDCPCTGGCPGGTHCQTFDGETFVCTPDCTTDADCGADHHCTGGVCYPNTCAHDWDCVPPRHCVSGVCVTCTVDADCPEGYFCVGGDCHPPTGGSCDDCTSDPPQTCNACGVTAYCVDCDDDAFNASLGSSVGDPNYNSDFDFDCNGNIDLADFAAYYGTCP